MTISDYIDKRIDGEFRIKGGRTAYESAGYPRNASGWWCIVERLIEGDGKPGKYLLGMRIIQRRIPFNTEIELL